MASHRYPKKTFQLFSIDLLGDWRPFATPFPLPGSHHEWRLCGTVTIDGITGGLAWKAGGHGVVIGENFREFDLWERMELARILEFQHPPGRELAPRFPLPENQSGQWSTLLGKRDAT